METASPRPVSRGTILIVINTRFRTHHLWCHGGVLVYMAAAALLGHQH